MSQTTFLIVAGVSLALLAASGNIDGFRTRPRMPQRVLSQAELQLFTTTRSTGEIVMAGSSGVVIDQGNQAIRVGTSAITFMAGTTADTEVVRIGNNGNVGIGTTNSSADRLAVQGSMRLAGLTAAIGLNDGNSGLAYSSTANGNTPFVGTGSTAKPSDGPVLFGQLDGALGTKSGGQANALYWNTTGVGIKNNAPAYALDVTGGVHATSNAVFDSNVGIGTATPAYKLDVTGGVHATSNAVFDSNVGIGTATPAYKLDVTGGVHATSNAIFDSKVGIGTNAPGASYALDVVGSVNFTGSLYQGGSLFKTSQWNTTGSDIVYTAGKIGVGTTQPTSTLHVAGGSNVNLSDSLMVKYAAAGNVDLGLNTLSLNLVVNGERQYEPDQSYRDTFWHANNSNIGICYTNLSTSLPLGSVITVNITALNAGGINITAWGIIINNATILNNFGALAATTYPGTPSNYSATLTLPATATSIGLYNYDNGTYLTWTAFSIALQTSAATNVGIGVTNPSSALQIKNGSTFDLGSVRGTWTDTGISAANAVVAAASPTPVAITGPTSGAYTATVSSSGYTSRAGYIVLASGLVSGATYQVTITASSTNSAPFVIRDEYRTVFLAQTTLTSTPTAYAGAAAKLVGGELRAYLEVPNAVGRNVTFSKLVVLRLDTALAGNVGIGTAAPAYTLDVLGTKPTLRIRANAAAYSGGTASLLFDTTELNFPLGKIMCLDATTVAGDSYRGDMAFYTQLNTTMYERMRITNGGTVGIGTTNPQGNFLMLHNPGSVSGISLGDYNMTARKYIGITVANGGTDIVDGHGFSGITFGVPSLTEGGCLIFSTHSMGVDSGERMRIAKNGFVGLGTTNPSQKLEVIGNIRLSGAVFGWSTTFDYYGGNPTWNPGDAGNWPIGGYKFILTLMGAPAYGGNAVRGTYMVFHSRWAAGNNNFCMITPIGNPQWISSTWITDGGMSFTFNSPSAQTVYIQAVAI